MTDFIEKNPAEPYRAPEAAAPAVPVTEEMRTAPAQSAPVQTFAASSTLPVRPQNLSEEPVAPQPVYSAPVQPDPVSVPGAPVYAAAQPVQEEPVYTPPVQAEPAPAVYPQEAPVEQMPPAAPMYAQPENNCTYHQVGAAGDYGSQPQPQPVYDQQVHQNYARQQAAYGQPAGYDPSAYNYTYVQQPAAPKKKMNIGTKAFLWVLLVCAIVSVVALIGVGVYTFVSGSDAPVTGDPVSSVESLPPTSSLPGSPTAPPTSGSEESTGPSSEVVELTPNSGISIHVRPTGPQLSAQEAYARVVDSTVLVEVTFTDANGNVGEGSGSGVIATEDGYIITNSHVVQDSRNVDVAVTTHSGEQYSAVVVGYDRTTDLAIIKINASGLQPATFGAAAEMGVGEQVITIGNPGGADFSFSMTGGYISGLDRHVGSYSSAGMTYIQTDAAINPGNSGGALVNMYGQVVGINSSKIVADEYENMGFAIPVDKAQSIICDLMSGGYVTGRVRLGISGRDVTDAQVYNYGVPYGFVIASVDPDSSFAGTGVQAGDIITAIDGEEVKNLDQLSNKLLEYSPGDTVTVTLYRLTTSLVENTYAGSYFNVEITLLADNGETQN